MCEAKYKMSINLQVLNHLGLNLYSNTSAVLSEVVANAWDADATQVDIKISGDTITITDNGNGMDLSDINHKYLTVGYQKRSESAFSPVLHRPVMGRKGIGKLSLFSIANVVEVFSHKNGETNGFKIDTDSLRKAIATNDEYYPTELSTDGIDLEGNGTKIILSNLKKKRTAALATHLRQRLARRFAIIGAKNQFKVLINDNEIVISDRNYLSKAQCVWVFPPKNQPDEFKNDLRDQTKADKLKLFKALRYKKASNKHLIIELKKGDRVVRTEELFAQVKKYFSATKKVMSTLDQAEPFEIIVLLGCHLDGKNYNEDVYNATKEALKAYNCRIMYYDELLRNAQNLYSDFLEKNQNLSTLSDIISELEMS